MRPTRPSPLRPAARRPSALRAALLTLLTLLVACAGGRAPADPAPGTGANSGEDDVPDVSPDSGDPTDTAAPQAPTLGVRVEEPALALAPGGHLRVAAVPLRFGGASGGPELGAALSIGELIEGAAELGLPIQAPEAHMGGLARAYPEVQGALYGLVVYVPDESGAFREGLPLLGVALDRLLLFRLPGEAPAGWPEGWSLVDSGMAGMYAPNRCLYDSTEPLLWREAEGYPRFSPLSDGVRIALRGRAAALDLEIDLAALEPSLDRLALMPLQRAIGADPTLALLDDLARPAEGTLAFTLEAPPPADHDLSRDPDWRHTFAYGLPYGDLDGSGAWSEADDTPGAGLCVAGLPVGLRYQRPVQSWRGLRLLDCYGAQVGWRLAHNDVSIGAERTLPAEDARRLASDPTCGL